MNPSRSNLRSERLAGVFDALADQSVVSLIVVGAAVFLGALDQTVIVTVLPAVVVDLQIPFNQIDRAAWIVSGYLLGYTVALPLVGQLADTRGRRWSLCLALGVFSLGSVGCALSDSLAFLVGARVVQAAGGGALLPVAIAVVSDRYPPGRRALAIGVVGAVAEAGGVLGPLYGAAIVSWLQWRWIFWLNLPFALIILLVALGGLRDRAHPTGRLDLPGAALIAAALSAIIVGLSHEEIGVAGIDGRLAFVGVGLAAIVAFLVWETRTAEPLLDLDLLRRAGFAGAIAGGLFLGGALIVAMVNVPLFAATVLGLSPGEGGLLLMRLTAFIPVGALLGGFAGQRMNLALPAAAGFVVSAAGLAMMSRWDTSPDAITLWVSLAVAGLGFGLLIAPLSTAAVNRGGVLREASSAALFSVARLTGMTIGLAALTTWGLQRFEELARGIPLPLPKPGESADALQNAVNVYDQAILQIGAEVYRELFLAAAVICIVGIATAATMWSASSRLAATESIEG